MNALPKTGRLTAAERHDTLSQLKKSRDKPPVDINLLRLMNHLQDKKETILHKYRHLHEKAPESLRPPDRQVGFRYHRNGEPRSPNDMIAKLNSVGSVVTVDNASIANSGPSSSATKDGRSIPIGYHNEDSGEESTGEQLEDFYPSIQNLEKSVDELVNDLELRKIRQNLAKLENRHTFLRSHSKDKDYLLEKRRPSMEHRSTISLDRRTNKVEKSPTRCTRENCIACEFGFKCEKTETVHPNLKPYWKLPPKGQYVGNMKMEAVLSERNHKRLLRERCKKYVDEIPVHAHHTGVCSFLDLRGTRQVAQRTEKDREATLLKRHSSSKLKIIPDVRKDDEVAGITDRVRKDRGSNIRPLGSYDILLSDHTKMNRRDRRSLSTLPDTSTIKAIAERKRSSYPGSASDAKRSNRPLAVYFGSVDGLSRRQDSPTSTITPRSDISYSREPVLEVDSEDECSDGGRGFSPDSMALSQGSPLPEGPSDISLKQAISGDNSNSVKLMKNQNYKTIMKAKASADLLASQEKVKSFLTSLPPAKPFITRWRCTSLPSKEPSKAQPQEGILTMPPLVPRNSSINTTLETNSSLRNLEDGILTRKSAIYHHITQPNKLATRKVESNMNESNSELSNCRYLRLSSHCFGN